MSLDEVSENGIQALLRFDFPAARAQFAAAADAATFTARAGQTGNPSDESFAGLGRIFQHLGQERGDALRKYLQVRRLIPRQQIGRLGGDRQVDVEPWYFSRHAVNMFPTKKAESDNPQKIIEKYILPGFLPEQPLIDRNPVLLTMGSCFAQELRNYLVENGMRSDWFFVPPGAILSNGASPAKSHPTPIGMTKARKGGL